MAKPSVVVPEVGVAVVCPCQGMLFLYPSPRAGITVRWKCLQVAQVELGVGLLNGWVESMRASLPTQAKAAAA